MPADECEKEKRTLLKKGFFITFEGGEGCGKTTQIKLLCKFLSKKGYPVITTYEPGATQIGELIRRILLSNHHSEISRETEALLYLACRAQHVQEIIAPALKEKKIVLCDRFTDSTLAYQGFARGIVLMSLQQLERFSRNGIAPDLTILLDADPRPMFLRLKQKHLEHKDRVESESLAFHQKVRKGYLALAKKNPKRYLIVNARKSVPSIHEEIKRHVMFMLNKKVR